MSKKCDDNYDWLILHEEEEDGLVEDDGAGTPGG